MTKVFNIIVIIAAIAVFSGCAAKTPADFNSDREIYEYGLNLFNNGKFSDAVGFFETVKNKYPTSPYIVEAEFKLGETYFKKGDYIEAIYALQSFNSLHPTNPKVPKALYMIGVSYYKQIPGSIDRDQANTTNCINIFDDLLRKYPEADDSSKARDILLNCKRMLAKRELYIANFYLKDKAYTAALGRLESLKDSYNFKDIKEEALYKIAYSHLKLNDPKKCKESFDTLLKMDPDEPYKKKAGELLAKAERTEEKK